MSAPFDTIDLSTEPATHVQSAAFYAVRDLRQGEKLVLITASDPALLMRSLDLQLRHNLAWAIVEADGQWRVEVTHRADVPPRDVLDLLARDHKRLDGLFVQALQCLNRNDTAAAAPLLRGLAAALRLHMTAEDEILTPRLAGSSGGAADDPLQIMLREHAEIRRQLGLIEEGLAAPEAAELGAFSAILSGTLAKHEHREEQNLFPIWRSAWARIPAADQDKLMSRVMSIIAGPEK
ncbi:MAG: hemerythrin domain-containing protein [Betaproteobacteria bacterium]|nr:hemerythrin domain-containing protein [Betaproteobacteria bacterium]